MSTKAKRHLHKYHRVELSFVKVWACALPDCNHFMPKHLEGIIPGKASICWGCGEKFILDDNNMKDDQPQCYDCKPLSTINMETIKHMIGE